jgi:hypothetical protein
LGDLQRDEELFLSRRPNQHFFAESVDVLVDDALDPAAELSAPL